MKKTTLKVKLLAFALTALLLSAAGCNQRGKGDAPPTTPSDLTSSETLADVTTGAEVTAETTAAENPALTQEKDKLKEKLIELMNDSETEKSQESPFTVFDMISGDYSLGNFNKTNLYGVGDIECQSLRNNIGYVRYSDGSEVYTVPYGYGLYVVSYADGKALLESVSATSGADFYSTSLLRDFGFNTAYFEISAAASGAADPVLSEDMIDVNDDLTVCTLSDTYLADVAEYMCDSLNEGDRFQFLSSLEAAGVYYVAERKVSIVCRGKTVSYGDVMFELAVYEKDCRVDKYTQISEMTVGGVKTYVEVTVSQLKYDGSRPVEATFYVKEVIEYPVEYQGNTVDYISSTQYNYYFDVADDQNVNISADLMGEYSVSTSLGTLSSSGAAVHLTISVGKNYIYDITVDSYVNSTRVAYFESDLLFDSSVFPQLPLAVVAAIIEKTY